MKLTALPVALSTERAAGTPTTWLAMKLTILLIIAACFQVSARGLAQEKITLSGKDIPFEKVIGIIQDQAGYVFFYKHELLLEIKNVTLSVKDADVEDVLKRCLTGQPVNFSIKGKTIFLFNAEASLSSANPSPDKSGLKGIVRDEAGAPLSGATITISNAAIRKNMTSNNDGVFSFQELPPGIYLLQISFVGYDSYKKQITIGEKLGEINVVLRQSVGGLDESVVKGYYTTTQRLNTGDVTTITSKEIEEQPVSDPLAALEGRVPGLSIVQQSGIVGNSFDVLLRGQNSIANGNNPLYIVDGVPFGSTSLTSPAFGAGPFSEMSPFNSLNPSDIESITVLKDADGTAIYGSRGANGVILITTKKGKAGKTRFNLTAYTGAGRADRTLPLMNTQQYLMMRREAFKNDNTQPGSGDYDINGDWDTTRYTNWQKMFIGGTSTITDLQGSISGGSENTQFIIGGGFHREGAVFPGDFSDQKASGRISLNHYSVDKRFHAVFLASYMNDDSKLPTTDFTNFIFLEPDAPAIYDQSGNLNWQNVSGTYTWNNPFASLLQNSNAVTGNLQSNLNLDYEILKGLNIRSSFGYGNQLMNSSIIEPLTSFSPAYSNFTGLRQNKEATTNIKTWIIEPQITYGKKFSESTVNFLVGSTFQENVQNSSALLASGFTSDALIPDLSAASSTQVIGATYAQYKYNSVYGRANYNWKEKYLLNVTLRRDGSSRFGPGKQFGNFGAVGAGWIFSEEKPLKILFPALSFGKIRASYGITGNDQIGDYEYLSTYSPNSLSYQTVNGLYPTSLSNPNYAWEQVKKFEVGLDLGLLENRIFLSANYYKNRDDNQLVGYPLPAITGFTSVQANLPATVQNTGDEFTLKTVNVKGKDFKWSSSFNLTVPRNKLVSYPGLAASPYAYRYAIGKPLYIQFLFHYTGVDPQTGMYTFETKNGNGVPSYPQDLQDQKEVDASYYGGVQNSFAYRHFQLDIFVQFVKQTGYSLFGSLTPSGFFSDGTSNQPTYVLNNWKQPGDLKNIQMYTEQYDPAFVAWTNAIQSDHTIEDASFIRLKNVSLSWSIPERWQEKTHLQGSKLYIHCQNLFTITKYGGLDPETQRGGITLPPLRVISFGFQTSL